MTDQTAYRDTKQAERDISDRDSLARARLPPEGLSRCHAVTDRDVTDGERDSDIATLKLRNVTITPAPAVTDRKAEDRERLAADPRFAAWVAGT